MGIFHSQSVVTNWKNNVRNEHSSKISAALGFKKNVKKQELYCKKPRLQTVLQ